MHGPGFDGGPLGHLFFMIVSGVVSLIGFAIVVALLFLLVRFLLVATKAAQLYVAKNGPAQPTAPTTSAAPTTPATKPRAPKTPPGA